MAVGHSLISLTTAAARSGRLASFFVPMSSSGLLPRDDVVVWPPSSCGFRRSGSFFVLVSSSGLLACIFACMYNRKYLSTIVLRPGVLIPWVLLPWVSYYTYYSGTGICADGLVHLDFCAFSFSSSTPFILITLITSFVTTETYQHPIIDLVLLCLRE